MYKQKERNLTTRSPEHLKENQSVFSIKRATRIVFLLRAMANCLWTATPHLTVSPPAADSTSSRSSIRLCNLSLTRTHSPSVVRNSSSSRRVGIYCSSDGGGGREQTETTGIQLYRDIERLDLIMCTIMLWCLINYNIRFWWL